MACYVIIIGQTNSRLRDPELVANNQNLIDKHGELRQPCTGCPYTLQASWSAGVFSKTKPATNQMYVLSFDGDDADQQVRNADAWLQIEGAWLNDPLKTIYTIREA